MSGFYDAKPQKFNEELKQKYAKLWALTNSFKIPEDFRHMEEPKEEDPVLSSDPIKKAYWSGIWAVLNELCEDGLIPESYLEKAFNDVEKEAA